MATSVSEIGGLLRHWRAVRRTSQLKLAVNAGTTPRYVSFVETGRAEPSRHMVLRLASALDVPLRERNDLLLAAGYAPVYSAETLDSPELACVELALAAMLHHHEPFPAVVMDRGWNVLRVNNGAELLFGRLLAPEPVPDPANVLRLIIEPGPVRDRVRIWEHVVPALLERARREAVGGVLDPHSDDLVRRLRERPEVTKLLATPQPGAAASPVIDIELDIAKTKLSFFSVVSTVGTPIDVNAQEIRLEAFFPSDNDTRAAWHHLTT